MRTSSGTLGLIQHSCWRKRERDFEAREIGAKGDRESMSWKCVEENEHGCAARRIAAETQSVAGAEVLTKSQLFMSKTIQEEVFYSDGASSMAQRQCLVDAEIISGTRSC